MHVFHRALAVAVLVGIGTGLGLLTSDVGWGVLAASVAGLAFLLIGQSR